MSNDFIPFAVGGSANVITQSAYAALTSVTQNGFQAGIAQSNQLNKVWRQSSIMAAVLAQFIVDQSGQNAVDDGTTATLETNLITAIKNATKQTVILADTGAANAYTATNTPALTALPSTGYVQRVNIAHANTGASTYAPDGLTAKPIYGLGPAAATGRRIACWRSCADVLGTSRREQR
jgi:kynureninase